MKYIDLHVHSNASDGTLTPSEVVDHAVSLSLAAFALTDHDTVSGLPKQRSAPPGILRTAITSRYTPA